MLGKAHGLGNSYKQKTFKPSWHCDTPDDDDTGPTIIINQQSSTRILILKAVKKKPANPEIGKKIPKCNENGEKHCQLSQYLLPNYLNINFN